MSKKVYKKQSNISDIGFGLFAGENIKKGSLITEFFGVKTSTPTDQWSVVHFNDKIYLQCNKNNLASYANDVIIFPKERRDFVDLINNNKELYQSYNNQSANAYIYQNDRLIRAWLKASRDIEKDEEIFVHYGLPFWFIKEMSLENSEDTPDTQIGIPSCIFKSESFKNYVARFYPDVTEIIPGKINNIEAVTLKTNTNSGFVLDFQMFLE